MEDFTFLKEAQTILNDQDAPKKGRSAAVTVDGETVIYWFGEGSMLYQKGGIFDPANRKPEGTTHGLHIK